MFLRKRAQSILEYAILLAIIIAAVVVMQVFIKRGVSGRLKDSSDRISGGSSFSASGTTTREVSNTTSRQMNDLTATDGDTSAIAGAMGMGSEVTTTAIADQGAYSASSSAFVGTGGTTSNSASRTVGASDEAFSANALTAGTATDFTVSDAN